MNETEKMKNVLLRLEHRDVIYTLLRSCFWHLLDYKSRQAKQKQEESFVRFFLPPDTSCCVPWIVKYDSFSGWFSCFCLCCCFVRNDIKNNFLWYSNLIICFIWLSCSRCEQVDSFVPARFCLFFSCFSGGGREKAKSQVTSRNFEANVFFVFHFSILSFLVIM